MGKLAILKIGDGDFEQGFWVTLRIGEDGVFNGTEIEGQLPPAPRIIGLYEAWQLTYHARGIGCSRRLEAIEGQQTNISVLDSAAELQYGINEWLNSGYEKFRLIRDRLLETLGQKNEDIRFIIQAEDVRLWRLPWHLWDIFARYSDIEVALSSPGFEQVKKLPVKTPQSQARILVILGDSPDINVQQDLDSLKQQLPDANIFPLVNPQRDQLSDELWEQDWDILFFAGHSSSEAGKGNGRIYINQTESLKIEELKYALKRAIAHGLKLAIFNSCDGLGLARYLTDLQIPAIVVMREPVPDRVAQKFLEYFLKTFAKQRKSLYASVREARERLHTLENQFPCASWLPVICQNPAQLPLTWQELQGKVTQDSTTGKATWQNRQILSRCSRLKAVVLASVVATALVIGVRHLGMLQPLELQTFDQMLRLRPSEGPDPRLLVVAITEDDFKLPEQQQRKGSLSERALALLLQKLESYQPQAIGLDVYHDYPFDPNQPNLVNGMQRSHDFVAICKVSEPKVNESGVAPPPEIPPERQGFSDFVLDPDGILRRYLIAMKPGPTSPCTTPYALSARLAFNYLEAKGIPAKYTQPGDLQIGKVVFKRWRSHMGGYQQVDDWGYQVLLSYCACKSPEDIAEKVTLKDVLTGSVKPEAVKNRIVLIGITAQSAGDFFATPYSTGQGSYQEMPGVILHAQMVSQMLKAVLDGRPLLWIWPAWGEALWVWGWSMLGGILVWRIRNPLRLVLAGAATLGVLYGVSFSLLVHGGWMPLVPTALALVITVGSTVAYTASREPGNNSNKLLY